MDCIRKPNCICGICGTPIYRRPGLLRVFKNVYCSLKCYRIATEPIQKSCRICKKLFRPEKTTARYCSRSCANISRRGIRYSKDRIMNNSRRRFLILREEFQFTQCMIEGCEYDKTFDIHRLASGKEGGHYELGNMFAICPNHHAEVSRGLITLEKVSDCQLRIIREGSTSGS
jgi:hypothetical protein